MSFSRQVMVHDSSVIRCLQYDRENETLRIHFQSGAKYDYLGVPALVFGTLVTSDSVGKAYNAIVKGTYETHDSRRLISA